MKVSIRLCVVVSRFMLRVVIMLAWAAKWMRVVPVRSLSERLSGARRVCLVESGSSLCEWRVKLGYGVVCQRTTASREQAIQVVAQKPSLLLLCSCRHGSLDMREESAPVFRK